MLLMLLTIDLTESTLLLLLLLPHHHAGSVYVSSRYSLMAALSNRYTPGPAATHKQQYVSIGYFRCPARMSTAVPRHAAASPVRLTGAALLFPVLTISAAAYNHRRGNPLQLLRYQKSSNKQTSRTHLCWGLLGMAPGSSRASPAAAASWGYLASTSPAASPATNSGAAPNVSNHTSGVCIGLPSVCV
jgi:hypothetical protein